MTANVSPHDVDNSCSNQAILNDEREEVGGGVLHNVSHDVDSSTGLGVDKSSVGTNQSCRS